MGRAPCCDKANVKKGPWSPEEDAKLKAYIEQHGTGGNWIALPQKIGLKRCGKSCRLRWLNYLRPNIKHGGFTEEEENIICSMYIAIGSRWSIIATQLPGRTDNDIKNYWNTRLKKKLMAKQRKEQAACHTGLLEQELKREGSSFLVNHTLNQIPYWAEQPLAVPMMHPHRDAHLAGQDELTGLLMKVGGQLYNDPQLMNNVINYQYPTQDQLYVDSSDAIKTSGASVNTINGNYNPWPNMEYDVNGANLNIHQGQGIVPVEIEAYLNNLLRIDGSESHSGIDIGNSSTTSNSAGSTSWGDMGSLVDTPVSNFDAYQKGMLQKVAQ